MFHVDIGFSFVTGEVPSEMQNQFDDARAMVQHKLEAAFIQAVYNAGVKRGRDLEFRTAQEHNEGMRKLNGG